MVCRRCQRQDGRPAGDRSGADSVGQEQPGVDAVSWIWATTVVVINARHAMFTGAKDDQKIYYRHTLYPGGLRETTVKEMFEKKPEKVIELAVKGMLPKTKLGKAMAKKLKVYADAEHRHTAQKPEAIEI